MKMSGRFGRGLAVGFVVAVSGLAWWGFRSSVRPGRPPAQAEQKQLYQCVMHPQIIQDHPGKCPICGMDLVPVSRKAVAAAQKIASPEEGKQICVTHACPMDPCPMQVHLAPGQEVACPICGMVIGAGAGTQQEEKSERVAVQIPLYRQQLIGVRTEPAAKREMVREIQTVGRVAYDPQLYQTQTEYLEALKALQAEELGGSESAVSRAKALVEAARTRLRLLGLGPDQIAALEKGSSADRSLLMTEGPGSAWVYAQIYEQDLPLVRPGQKAEMTAAALPGKTFEGEIQSLDPVLQPSTRSARARIFLRGEAAGLKPDTYVTVSLRVPLGERLAVPSQAVLDSGRRQWLFVVLAGDRFDPRLVRLGQRAGDWVEILEGVSEGEKVVTSGNFLIDSDSQLKAAAQAMTFYGGKEAAGERSEPTAHRH